MVISKVIKAVIPVITEKVATFEYKNIVTA